MAVQFQYPSPVQSYFNNSPTPQQQSVGSAYSSQNPSFKPAEGWAPPAYQVVPPVVNGYIQNLDDLHPVAQPPSIYEQLKGKLNYNQQQTVAGLENTLGNVKDNVQAAAKPVIDAVQGASLGAQLTGGMQAVSGLFDAYNQYKTNKLAKESFKFKKMESNRNYEGQKNTVNAQLADRQKNRVARDPNHFESVSDYMNKYGIK